MSVEKASSSTLDLEKANGSAAAVVEPAVVPEFDDPNADPDVRGLAEDDSPYPEVRSAVANTDDPSIPVSTLRTWVVGLLWAILIPGLNQFFFFRFPCP